MPEVISLSKGRFKTTLERYPQFKKELALFKNEDPSRDLKYLFWQVKQLVCGECADEIVSLTKQFHTQNAKLKEKDLNQYKTLADLHSAFEALSKKEEAKLLKKDAVKIYEDERYVVIFPKTEEASCKYGRDTQWCISATEGGNEFVDLLLYDNVVFYFIIDRAREKRDSLHKLALVYERDEHYNAWLDDIRNANNTTLSSKKAFSSIVDDKVRNKIKTAIEEHLLNKPKIEHLEKVREAQDINASAETLTTLASDKNASVRYEVAANTNTPAETLTTLASDKNASVRYVVAANTNIPAETLAMLAKDKSSSVRGVIARKRTTSAEALLILAKDEDDDIRQSVAENKNAPAEALAILAKDKDKHIRCCVAKNANTPAEVLINLAKDRSKDVRHSVAKNISTPAEVLATLTCDKNDTIRFYALQRFRSVNESSLSK